MSIIYCMMVQNNLHDAAKCVENALPYVDHIVLVDGGSLDDSIPYFRNMSLEEPKLHFYIHPWCDRFYEQRNNYLKHAEEFAKDGDFILVSDPDEFFEEKTFQNLPKVGKYLVDKGFTAAGFQCRSVSLKGEKRVWENVDNYWKHLFYKWEPGIHYIGNPHETMVIPSGFRMVNTPFMYEHVKQENVIWVRGARNAYIGGGGPNLSTGNPHWLRLKNIVEEIYGSFISWHEFQKEMLKGNLDDKIKAWMFDMKNETGWDGASEMREFYKTYFRLYHPSEEPEEFRGTHIE